MPFNVWCGGCERHIASGVRFNAEKKQIGKYYSTPIYSFRMKCPSCPQWLEIHTDPKNATYQVVSGGRKRNENWTAEDNETAPTLSNEELARLKENPLARVEHEVQDQRKAAKRVPQLQALKEAKDAAYRDDWSSSQQLRKRFRAEAAVHKEAVSVADDIRKRGGMSLKLLPEHPQDIQTAQSIDFCRVRKESKQKDDLLLPSINSIKPLVKKKDSN